MTGYNPATYKFQVGDLVEVIDGDAMFGRVQMGNVVSALWDTEKGTRGTIKKISFLRKGHRPPLIYVEPLQEAGFGEFPFEPRQLKKVKNESKTF